MDEELEQRGVTPESFFDQATETREMVQTVQKTSNSNLSLLNPIYLSTAKYGHFGREDQNFSWEKTKNLK